MELRHFKYFITVAEYLHFGRAAKALRIAQPVLSRHIQQMENEIGVRLFERTRRSVTLTHAGSVFLISARQILSQSENALLSSRRAATGRLGTLRIASGPVTTYCLLPSILGLIKDRLPDVDLQLSHAATPEQVSSLLSNDIDVAFLVPPLNDTGLKTELVYQEHFVAVVPRGHRLAKVNAVSLRELNGEDFIFPTRRTSKSGLYGTLENICHNAGFIPKIAHEAYPIQTILALVESGFGISIVPESVQRFMRANVVFVTIRDHVNIQFLMATRQSESSPVVAAFVGLVRQLALKSRKKAVGK